MSAYTKEITVNSETKLPHWNDTICQALFTYENIPLISCRPKDKVTFIVTLCKRKNNGTYYGSICVNAWDRNGDILGPHGKPHENSSQEIDWEWLLRCPTLYKDALFKKLFNLKFFNEVQGDLHDGFDENFKYLPCIEYRITQETVDELTDVINNW